MIAKALYCISILMTAISTERSSDDAHSAGEATKSSFLQSFQLPDINFGALPGFDSAVQSDDAQPHRLSSSTHEDGADEDRFPVISGAGQAVVDHAVPSRPYNSGIDYDALAASEMDDDDAALQELRDNQKEIQMDSADEDEEEEDQAAASPPVTTTRKPVATTSTMTTRQTTSTTTTTTTAISEAETTTEAPAVELSEEDGEITPAAPSELETAPPSAEQVGNDKVTIREEEHVKITGEDEHPVTITKVDSSALGNRTASDEQKKLVDLSEEEGTVAPYQHSSRNKTSIRPRGKLSIASSAPTHRLSRQSSELAEKESAVVVVKDRRSGSVTNKLMIVNPTAEEKKHLKEIVLLTHPLSVTTNAIHLKTVDGDSVEIRTTQSGQSKLVLAALMSTGKK